MYRPDVLSCRQSVIRQRGTFPTCASAATDMLIDQNNAYVLPLRRKLLESRFDGRVVGLVVNN